jgi:hypothetical protein
LWSPPSIRGHHDRIFPPAWRAEPIPGGYVVRDASGQALANLYSRDNPTEALQAKILRKDEARRIAVTHRAAAVRCP